MCGVPRPCFVFTRVSKDSQPTAVSYDIKKGQQQSPKFFLAQIKTNLWRGMKTFPQPWLNSSSRCRYTFRPTKHSHPASPLRLSSLYKDLASLSIGGYCNGFQPLSHKEGGRRREARKLAGEFLLQQMTAAGDEAR